MTPGSLPRPRYSRARRAAVVAACASVLTGTAMALPAATFAGTSEEAPPIVSLSAGNAKVVNVPDPGLPLPKVELNTDDVPVVSTLTGAVGLTAIVDTQPQAEAPNTSQGPATEPAPATRPASDVPSDEEAEQAERVERGWAQPTSDVPSDRQASAPATTDAALPSSGRGAPATAVADAQPSEARPIAAAPESVAPVDAASVQGVLEIKDQKLVDQRAAVRAAQVLGTEKSAVASKEGLGLAAPLTDLASRGGIDTLNLSARSGPASATGDWNMLPEALYAMVPLLLAGAAVVAHNRRSARLAAASVGVVQRRRHAGR